MTTATEVLPIENINTPRDSDEVVEKVKECFHSETPLYPLGGQTSLDFGLPAKQPGLGLSLLEINRIIDYPARDMTITVEAGVTLKQLADALAKENQEFPIDVPFPEQATLGGVVATNWNGPRRYGLGLVRDYVIGVSAIDGQGRRFQGGGRVVKNVAGYDFCKLLTGSLGALGLITQITLKVRPLPERSEFLICPVNDLDQAEKLLAALVTSQTQPVAIELLGGPAWEQDSVLQNLFDDAEQSANRYYLAVGLEGTDPEVQWMKKQLAQEWRVLEVAVHQTLDDEQSQSFWRRLADFPAGDSPLVIKASMVPSGVTRFVETVKNLDPACSFQSHAGSGAVIVRFSEFPQNGLSRTLIGTLQPAASKHHGHIVVLSNPSGAEMTHQAVWGADPAQFLMSQVKNQFDPKNILNPGRFVV